MVTQKRLTDILVCFASVVILSSLSTIASHAYPVFKKNGVALCTESEDQYNPQMILSGPNSAYVVWQDRRGSGAPNLYMQKIRENGVAEWEANGIWVECTGTSMFVTPHIIEDNAKGVVVAWLQDWSIRSQRVTLTGDLQWLDRKSELRPGGYINRLNIIHAGNGQTILGWQDNRHHPYDIFAQKINENGDLQWDCAGNTVCIQSSVQSNLELASDGSGGAYIVWEDDRGADLDIYAQRINSNGQLEWDASGVVICNATGDQKLPKIIENGAGGAIVVWQDHRNTNKDLYAQKLNATGVSLWTANGTPLCTQYDDQDLVAVVSDGNGGALITWEDQRNASTTIYAQKMNNAGVAEWPLNGVAISNQRHQCSTPAITADNSNGAVIVWQDYRNYNWDIFLQRLDSNGDTLLTEGGVSICDADGVQKDPKIVKASHSVMITWQDKRNGNEDIYCQQYSFDLATPTPTITVTPTPVDHGDVIDPKDNPNIFFPMLGQSIQLNGVDPTQSKVTICNRRGKIIRTLHNADTWDGKNQQGNMCEGGIYIYQVESPGKRVAGQVVLLK